MIGRDPEYDRFGPWVLEISDEDPPPPLFRAHLTRTDTALLSIKIPRKISRRDAHPGMDLYDYVVSLYEHDMVILQRVERDVRTETVRYCDVKHLRIKEALLRGNVHLAMPGRTYDLPFNTVSRDVMDRVVELIRARYQDTAGGDPVAVAPVIPEGLSFYFGALLDKEQQAGSSMRLVAAQADAAMREQEPSTWRRIVFGLVDKQLLESLHLCDGLELKIMDRGAPYAYRWQSTYGREVSYIPLVNIDRAEWDADAGNRGVTRLALWTQGGACSYVFTQDNPTLEGYRTWLGALTAGRPR